MIDFRYWLRLPWPITSLDGEDSAQISKNLGHFLHFWNFWHKKQSFLLYAPHHLALAFDGSLQMKKLNIFGFFMKKYAFLPMAKKFL